jgi:broad specificity phosphatase PhoE
MRKDAPLWVHWVRHAKVASHQGNLPLTSEGRRQVEDAGQQFSRKLVPGEVVALLHAPTRRTRESALILYSSMVETLDYEEQPEVYLCDALTDDASLLAPLSVGA